MFKSTDSTIAKLAELTRDRDIFKTNDSFSCLADVQFQTSDLQTENDENEGKPSSNENNKNEEDDMNLESFVDDSYEQQLSGTLAAAASTGTDTKQPPSKQETLHKKQEFANPNHDNKEPPPSSDSSSQETAPPKVAIQATTTQHQLPPHATILPPHANMQPPSSYTTNNPSRLTAAALAPFQQVLPQHPMMLYNSNNPAAAAAAWAQQQQQQQQQQAYSSNHLPPPPYPTHKNAPLQQPGKEEPSAEERMVAAGALSSLATIQAAFPTNNVFQSTDSDISCIGGGTWDLPALAKDAAKPNTTTSNNSAANQVTPRPPPPPPQYPSPMMQMMMIKNMNNNNNNTTTSSSTTTNNNNDKKRKQPDESTATNTTQSNKKKKKKVRYTDPVEKEFFELTDKDVVMGRGDGPNKLPGNVRFRNIIKAHLQEYSQINANGQLSDTDAGLQKCAFTQRIVDDYDGRFLKKDATTGRYYQASAKQARQKVSQKLRDYLLEQVRQQDDDNDKSS